MAQIKFRTAVRTDLSDIVRMLADDPLGAAREEFTEPLPVAYSQAFEAIDSDPNQELIVAQNQATKTRLGSLVSCS